MVRISDIRINYEKEPMGVESIEQIGWVIISKEKGVFQQSYHVQISEDERYENLIYDSGVVESGESAHVEPEGVKLRAAKLCHIRVCIRTTDGEESGWTESHFLTAIPDKREWKAEFVSIETEADKEKSSGFYLRKEVALSGEVASAYAYTTALGLYHFYINGRKVGEDEFTPGWTSYNKRLLYQAYDVTEYLTEKRTALGAIVGAGWYKGVIGMARERWHYGDTAAFAMQLFITYRDGRQEVVLTDDSWTGAESPVEFSEFYDGEIYHAGKEIPHWNEPGCTNGEWKSVHSISFEPSVLTAQSGARVRQIDRLPVKRIFQTPQGDTVLDFGQNLTGWVEFKVKGKPGDVVELNCFEILDAQGNVYLDNLRGAKQTVTYICGAEKNVSFHPLFSFQGFQYVRVARYPGEICPEDFQACTVHSALDCTGVFECSNQDLNQLQHNILWGMKGNFLDVPTDCPQRDERLGWTGDVQIFCRTACYLMDTYTFYRKWLADLAADQTKEGGVPHVVPDILSGQRVPNEMTKKGVDSAAAWADAAVIVPWTLYLVYGDKYVLKTQYDSMKAWIDFMVNHSENYRWSYMRQFGDWLALDAEEGSYLGATPNELTCMAYFAYSTSLFAKIAKILGREEDAEKYGQLFCEIRKEYQKTFFDEMGHLNVQTQTAQILTLYFELSPEEYKERVVEDLLKLLKKRNGHLATGFVGTPYFCHVLGQNGCTREAYELLMKEDFPSWLYEVKCGATTIWEHWDGLKPDGTMWSPAINSFNHYAYGAVGDWLYRGIAGINSDDEEPGYKHIVLEPQIGDLDYVRAEYRSQYGVIGSYWIRQGDRIELKIKIPCNTRATIRLRGAGMLLENDGLTVLETSWGMELTADSGEYRILYALK